MSTGDRIWHIKLGEATEGPYRAAELVRDARVDYDTLVWREGFERWKELREVPELVELWRTDPSDSSNGDGDDLSVRITPDGLVVDTPAPQPNQFWWLVLIGGLVVYVVVKLLF